jgi:hypothetical protein
LKASFIKEKFIQVAKHGSEGEMFQAESVRDAAFGCNWVGAPIQFQRCLMFIIATANKEFQLTAGKFVPVSNVTMMNVRI